MRERLRSLRARPHPAPLFVFGNQKSGTSAITGLLAAATGRAATIDLSGATEPHLGRLLHGETTLDDFIRRNAFSFSRPIVKEGNLTFMAKPLMDHFGVSRAIFILRNPYDNIRSILNRLRLPGDLAELDARRLCLNRTWRAILSGTDLGFEPDHYVATLARRWQRAAEIYEQMETRFVPVRYHDFMADKTGTIRRLAQECALPVRHDITPLLGHRFQRRGDAGTDLRRFFGSDNLARIAGTCGDTAERLGFPAP
ncbi:MAG: hypothetical protein KGR48_00955 [Alphaproteobacteria bacterium]|nr:hypothetical protein [Alphaproteobacteria bacterium]MBU6472661.1 hypothetical protein [Alphaproteobacteria bacterium]MDE2012142.1 hypothetical protein [Alphaproteobacteria bacterium]MDE2072155.1 hypothetical protein [Alphaproteobacteria bacterium]MDE2353149.1 hypothetical protein [Alphaproteobacteria bacterium]